MLDIKTKRGVTDISLLEGDAVELAADTLVILNAVYETICENNSVMAESFARAVKNRINSKRDTPFRIISEP